MPVIPAIPPETETAWSAMALSLCVNLSDDEQSRLLAIARQSIESGLVSGCALQLDVADMEHNLSIESAVFVTLTQQRVLRGCIGSLQATAPLAQAVATSSYNAAFRDRRFAPLQDAEIDDLQIEISVLSEMEPIECEGRETLLESLHSGVDGLLLEDREYRATFLPKVWDKLATPSEFLEQLLVKAGLSRDHWSSTIRFYRYHTLNFCEN